VKNCKLSIIAFALAFNLSYALDPMYDYRYTLGPEIVVPDAFIWGGGGWTHYTGDLYLMSNLQIGLTDRFEIGAKIMGKFKRWYSDSSLVDIGTKFAISRNLALQADVPIAINSERGWGGVLSISQWDGYTKKVSFIHEGRLGFGSSAGKDRYVKISYDYFQYFQISDSFRISVGALLSSSAGNYEYFKKDFMGDIMPRVEFGILHWRFMGEVSIGIWPENAENRYAVYVTTDI